MGFDFYIKLRLSLCEKTGKPFMWDYPTMGKNYDLSTIIVPEKYRGFITMRGHIFHLYTTDIGLDACEAEISDLLDDFPSWEDIQEQQCDDDEWWTEEDHNNFHEALLWFDTQAHSFYATWSY
jgi:hypothetical protein